MTESLVIALVETELPSEKGKVLLLLPIHNVDRREHLRHFLYAFLWSMTTNEAEFNLCCLETNSIS